MRALRRPGELFRAVGWLALIFLLSDGVLARGLTSEDEAVSGAGGGFLEGELPLRVVVTTPTALSSEMTSSLRLSGKQAITVVYSRPVIALGQDFGTATLPDDKVPFTMEPTVPGLFRWVTTYIARWDPDGSLPLDTKINFKFNHNLKTHDGILFNTTGLPNSIMIATSSLHMSLRGITSKKAQDLSEGQWDPDARFLDDILPEVPPDGVLQLSFDHDVSISAFTEKVQIFEGQNITDLKVVAWPCPSTSQLSPMLPCLKCNLARKESLMSPEESSCAQVHITGDLKVQTRYIMSLPQGTKYSKKAGPLTGERTVSFGGLRNFRIPLQAKQRINSQVLLLSLPHGLAEPTSKGITALKEQFQFINTKTDEKIDFDLKLKNKAVLEMRAPLMPREEYRLTIAESSKVLDGFGLPLFSTSSVITTGFLQDQFDVVGGRRNDILGSPHDMVFEAGQNWGKKLLAAYIGNFSATSECPGLARSTVHATRPIGGTEMKATIAALQNGYPEESISKRFRSPGISFTNTTNDRFGELAEADISRLLKPSGVVLYEHCKGFRTSSRGDIDVRMVTETDLQVIAMGTSVGPSPVFITSMKTGKPISGAKVTLYKNAVQFQSLDSNKVDPQDIEFVARKTTNEEGIALFDSFGDERLHLHVEHRMKSVFVWRVSEGSFQGPPGRVSRLVLDKKLAQPGQSIFVKGYVLQPTGRDDLSWEPSRDTPVIRVSPSLNPDKRGVDDFTVEIDAKLGVYEVEIPVPENAPLRQYFISRISQIERPRLLVQVAGSTPPPSKYRSQSDSFIVADPRPPTVDLTIKAPFWAHPNSTVSVDLIAESFIGSAVGDAEIVLKWRVAGSDGEITAVTDSSGKATVDIDLADVATSPGDTLGMDASWVGPTREIIERSASVRLELADMKLQFHRTVSTDFPGQEFGARATLTDLRGAPLEKRNLLLQLKQIEARKDESGLEPLDGSVVDSCETASDSKVYGCRFTLPDVGAFALETCVNTQEEGGQKRITFCSRVFLGKTAEQWDQNPVARHIVKIGFESLSQRQSRIGEINKFGFENPFHGAKGIAIWGSNLGTRHKTFALEDFSYNEVEVEVDKNCMAGCSVRFAISIPRQTSGVVVQNKVPVSKLFDLAMPHTASFESEISVHQDNTFGVDLSFPELKPDENNDVVVAPGETTEIKVQLPEGESGITDVTVVAVDKAILDLIPYPLQDLASHFLFNFTGSFTMQTSTEHLISPSAIEALIQDFARRKELYPWFTPVMKARFSHAADISDADLQDHTSRFITSCSHCFLSGSPSWPSFPRQRLRGDFEYDPNDPRVLLSIPTASGLRTGSNEITASDDGSPQITARVQKSFIATPLFKSVVTEEGVATVNFTAPDNLSTFIVRAYASTGTGRFGNAEKEIIVRRTISLTPSAPRFARVGDVFEAGAVVTVSGSAKSRPSVSIRVALEGETDERLELLDSGNRTYEAGSDGTDEIRFKFRAKKIGDATFKITAAVGNAGDALVIDFPIEGLQESVAVASSFAIDGNSTQQWTEGLQLPDAVPGSGGIKIQAGVGRMPVILSLAEEIYSSNPEHKCPINAHESLAKAVIPFITETYKVLDLDRNSLASPTVEVLDGMLSNMTAALGSLRELTNDRLGLMSYLRCPNKSPRTHQTRPWIHLNAQGVWLLATLRADIGNSLLEDKDGQRSDSLALLEETWTTVLSQALVMEAVEARNEKVPRAISLSTVALARWALGGDWTPPFNTDETIRQDLSMDRLSERFEYLGIVNQAYYIHARMGMVDGINHPDVHKAIDSWTTNIRVGGRTAYVATRKGSARPAGNLGQTLVLSVMTKAGIRTALVEKMANYIGGPPTGPYGFWVFGNFDKVVTMISLREYDVARGSNQPDLNLRVRSGDVDLMKVLFQGNNQVVASSSTPWELLASPPKPLEFQAEGIGEVTMAASLMFVPAKLLPFPTYRGMFIQRTIRISGSQNGPSLKTIPVGSVVEVFIQITTPDPLARTTVTASMPAGLEPIDPNVDGSRKTCPVRVFPLFFNRINSFYSFFSCPDQETRPSVVTFTYGSLSSGTHSLSFQAVAATAGEFALPPVRAFVNEQPELMGLSKAGSLTVCSGDGCQPEEDTLPKLPKMCPKNCNDNGGCDLDTGTCLCLPGFSGDDCGQYVAA